MPDPFIHGFPTYTNPPLQTWLFSSNSMGVTARLARSTRGAFIPKEEAPAEGNVDLTPNPLQELTG